MCRDAFGRIVNGCHEIVKSKSPLTTVSSLGSVLQPSPSFEGFPSSKEEQMLRNAFYVKFVLLMLVLAALAVVVAGEPWGPN
jgi:hypothetical protein